MIPSNFDITPGVPGGDSKFLSGSIIIEKLQKIDELQAIALVRKTFSAFENASRAAELRLLDHLYETHQQNGFCFYVAKDMSQEGLVVGTIGLGSLHGLPVSEGVGEIRMLVVSSSHRGQGLGRRLIENAITEAKKFGYERLYLETTHKMVHAQNLFQRMGFRAVTEGNPDVQEFEKMPSYFLLENLQEDSSPSNPH